MIRPLTLEEFAATARALAYEQGYPLAGETATTFGRLGIGRTFWWRNTPAIQHGPRGPEPMRKTSATRYDWSRGYGHAEPHYPVWRITGPRRGGRDASRSGR